MKVLKNFLKEIIKKIAFFLVRIFSKFKIGRLFIETINDETFNLRKKISYNNIDLNFYIPNELNLYRVDNFYDKEPETIEWINNFDKGSIFWDIGSNIGLYSCYAAKKKDCVVYSFEPSVFNLEILCKNISLNKLNEKITVFPLPITDTIKDSKFKFSSTLKGGAISTFGEDFTFDGTKLNTIFEYKTTGISINEIDKYFKFLRPDYMKIDVDVIDHLIFDGASEILASVKEILVEVDEKFDKQFNQVNDILKNS